MKISFIGVLLIISSGIAFGQPSTRPVLKPIETITIPVVIFDTMTYEVMKGRACVGLVEAQRAEILKLGILLVSGAEAIELKDTQISQQGAKIDRLEAVVSNQVETIDLEKDKVEAKFKAKLKRVWGWFVGIVVTETTVLILVLVLI